MFLFSNATQAERRAYVEQAGDKYALKISEGLGLEVKMLITKGVDARFGLPSYEIGEREHISTGVYVNFEELEDESLEDLSIIAGLALRRALLHALVKTLSKLTPEQIGVTWCRPEFPTAGALLRQAKKLLLPELSEPVSTIAASIPDSVLICSNAFVEYGLSKTDKLTADYAAFYALESGQTYKSFGFNWLVEDFDDSDKVFAFNSNALRLYIGNSISVATICDNGNAPVALLSHLDVVVELIEPLKNAVRLVQ